MENLLPSAFYSQLNEPQWFRERSQNPAKNNRIDAVTGLSPETEMYQFYIISLIHISHCADSRFFQCLLSLFGFKVANSPVITF